MTITKYCGGIYFVFLVEYEFFVIATLKFKVIFLFKKIKVDALAYIPATLIYIFISVSLLLALGRSVF